MQTIGDPIQPGWQIGYDGTQLSVTVIGEAGRSYELWVSDDLEQWAPVWTGFLFGSCDGFRRSFGYFEDVSRVPRRFYQARETHFRQ